MVGTKISALDVASYFLHKSQSEGKSITNKKLQKLVYYAQAWHLALKHKPLFDEQIEAWIHGPAIPSVYVMYKSYSYHPIETTSEVPTNLLARGDIISLLNEVWNIYGKYDGDYLEVLSHSELPWQEAREDLSSLEASTNAISLSTMEEFYSNLINSK